MKEAIELAEYIRDLGYMPEQVQDFYPTPSTLSTCMYYTGLDPATMEKVYTPVSHHEKEMQRALIQYRNPDNYDLVKEALIKNGRTDLIGFGPKCLIPPRKISHNTGGKNFSSGKHKTVKNTTAYNNKGKHNSAGAGKRSSNNKSKSTKKGHKL